jgi:hypothetical protein
MNEIATLARSVLKHRKHCPTCRGARPCLAQDALLNRWARAWLEATEELKRRGERLDEIAEICREALGAGGIR